MLLDREVFEDGDDDDDDYDDDDDDGFHFHLLQSCPPANFSLSSSAELIFSEMSMILLQQVRSFTKVVPCSLIPSSGQLLNFVMINATKIIIFWMSRLFVFVDLTPKQKYWQ